MKKKMRDIELIITELQAALKREAANIIAIGSLLLEAQDQLDHGEWLPWLKENFGSTNKTAENYMAAARFSAKFETVSDLKLRPTTLYLLGRELEKPTGLYSPKIIKAILKAAETKWINVAEAHAIAKSLQPSKTLEGILAQPFNEAIEKSKAEQAAADKAEAEAILDGTPPELPASEATIHNVFLPSFDRAAETMLLMRTKPLDSFFGTALGPDRFRDIVAFLQAFITAFERRNEGNAEAVVRKGAARCKADES